MIIALQCYVGVSISFQARHYYRICFATLKKGVLHWILKTKDEMKI